MVTATKLTYQDYLDTPGDERYELLDGELILVASPNRNHQTTSMELGSRMHSFAKENDLGWVFHAPYDVLLTESNVVQPDLLFISKERKHISTPANIQGAPEPDRRNPVTILRPPRLGIQARAIRQPRSQRVLDRRSHQPTNS